MRKFKIYRNSLAGEIYCAKSKTLAWNYFWTQAKLKGNDLPTMDDIVDEEQEFFSPY